MPLPLLPVLLRPRPLLVLQPVLPQVPQLQVLQPVVRLVLVDQPVEPAEPVAVQPEATLAVAKQVAVQKEWMEPKVEKEKAKTNLNH